MLRPTNNPYDFKYLQIGFKTKALRTIYLPPQPRVVDDLGENKWVRPEPPKDWELWEKEERAQQNKQANYTHPKKAQYINREWDRRDNGYWFMNKNRPTYITGLHYYLLTHFEQLTDEGRYFGFMDSQKEVFYFIQYCEEDPACYGALLNTLRRFGKSSIMAVWLYEYITRNIGVIGGIQAQSEDRAKEFYLNTIVTGHEGMTSFFKCKTTENHAKGLDFRERRVKSKETYEELKSKITYTKSTETAYDGYKLHRYVCEEPGKPADINVLERHRIIKPCLTVREKIIGKAMYATTVEDMEDKGGLYQKLFEQSDWGQRDDNNQTISGLYSAFMPAYCGFSIDEYGMPDIEYSKTYLLNKRKQLEGDPQALAGEIRKFPFTINEAFYSGQSNSQLNMAILNDTKNKILNAPHKAYGRFDLEWENGQSKGMGIKVRAVPNPHSGRFYIHEMPKDGLANSFIANGDIENPNWHIGNHVYKAGIDPIDHSQTIQVGSNPAAVIMSGYNPDLDGETGTEKLAERSLDKYEYKSNKIVAYYLFRPSTPTEFYRDMIKFTHFYGAEAHIESNKIGLIEYMGKQHRNGTLMRKFRLDGTLNKANDPYGTPSGDSIIDKYYSLMIEYVQHYGHTIVFERIVEDLINFDRMNTRKYDIAVALAFCLMALAKNENRGGLIKASPSQVLNLHRIVNGQSVKIKQ